MDNDPTVNQLVRAVYSPNSTSLQMQNAVILSKRSFKESAGFAKGQGIENDKWLQTLSIDDTLQAVASAFRNTKTLSFEELSKTTLDMFKSLYLEKSLLAADTSLDKLIAPILGQQNEAEALSCLSKMFARYNKKLMLFTPEILLKMLEVHPKALGLCYEDYKRACCNNSKDHWMVASSFQSPELYTKFCDFMLETSPSYLQSFITICSKRGNIFTLYSGHEQSIVFLMETSTRCGTKIVKDNNVKIIFEKLLGIVQTNPKAASKLLQQFPCLGEWIVEYSDENEAAQRVCLWTLTLNLY